MEEERMVFRIIMCVAALVIIGMVCEVIIELDKHQLLKEQILQTRQQCSKDTEIK